MSSPQISPLIAPRPSQRAGSRALASYPGLRWSLWGQWTAANMAAEALGLGGTLLIGVALFTQATPLLGAVTIALLAAILLEIAAIRRTGHILLAAVGEHRRCDRAPRLRGADDLWPDIEYASG
jgi:hypothetical protein